MCMCVCVCVCDVLLRALSYDNGGAAGLMGVQSSISSTIRIEN